MTRRRLLIAVLLIAAACGSPSEVAPTTAAGGAEGPSTTAPGTTEPRAETTSSVVVTTSSMVDTHGDGVDHEDDNHDDPDATGEARVVEIIMTDFAFAPAAVEVVAGDTIRFVVVNEGVVEHELRLSNQHRVDEHLASGHDDHGDDGHHAEDGDVSVLVPVGETAEFMVEIPEDVTVYTLLACLLPGHYEAGMMGWLVYA